MGRHLTWPAALRYHPTANPRAIIHRAAATVPYHDLLEYWLFGQLEDTQFTVVVDWINGILSGVPVPQAHSADFINLPKKTPHGPIANGEPLTNLATVWKFTAALIKDHYQPRLVQGGILPPYQFGMSPHCSSMELLRVLHDVWWDRSRRRLEAWVLPDDIRPAYGSNNHTTEYAVLTAAGISPADTTTLQHHDRALEVHMGGADERSPVLHPPRRRHGARMPRVRHEVLHIWRSARARSLPSRPPHRHPRRPAELGSPDG